MKKYYVYAYLREDRYSPYYIGKGCGRRIDKSHGKKATPPPEDRRVKIKEGLTEESALDLEALLIKQWGRKEDGGVLLNELEGGTQPPLPKKGRKTWNKGLKGAQKHSEETKRKIGEANKGRPQARSRPVMLEGVVYPSVREAIRSSQHGRTWVYNRITYV